MLKGHVLKAAAANGAAVKGAGLNAAALIKPTLLMLAMFGAATTGAWLRPQPLDAATAPAIALDELVPTQIGGWRIDERFALVQPDPDTLRKLDQLYSATLARAYVDASGYHIMLSIAYGRRQTDTLRAHLPELCYTAQGFAVEQQQLDHLDLGTGYSALPVTRLLTRNALRTEPVTYWLNISGSVVNTQLQRKLTSLAFGLRGAIPDGMLVRVSSVDADSSRAFAQQDHFLRALRDQLTVAQRTQLFGDVEHKGVAAR